MKVTLHSTSKVVDLETRLGAIMPARVWEGRTAASVPVVAFITRIAAEREADLTEFQAELQEYQPPTATVQSWPARMLID